VVDRDHSWIVVFDSIRSPIPRAAAGC